MRSRSAPMMAAALLALLVLGCGGHAAAPPEAPDSAEPDEEEEAEEIEEPVAEPEPEPPFADTARQSVRASDPPRNTLGLHFVVAQHGADLPWLVVIANQTDAPVAVAGDMRLLRFEVEKPTRGEEQPRKAQPPKPEICELPATDRPGQVDRELLVELGPGLLLAHPFDPRLICEPEWLVPGAKITPKFGWPIQTRTVWRQGKRVEEPVEQTDPYVAAPGQEADAQLAPVKELLGEPFILDASYAPPAPDAETSADELPPLELSVRNLGTTKTPEFTNITIELKNPARKGRHLFFRREFITYEVIGPHRTTTCNVFPDERVPARQSFDFIGAGGTMRVASRLAEMCPREAFGPPGLYRVHARLDATESGSDHGIQAFTGIVTSRQPGLLRIRGGRPTPMWLLPIRPARTETAYEE